MQPPTPPVAFATLGMFIIDDFLFLDEHGRPSGRTMDAQEGRSRTLPQAHIGGGGTYAAIGARIWLPPAEIGMIVDRGHDFPAPIHHTLLTYGPDMWLFRDHPDLQTTRALNSYRGEHRGFEYSTPRIRITPKDLDRTRIETAKTLHFICSPTRALAIMSQVRDDWQPITIFEPIPDRCVPEELPSLRQVLPLISVLSPNAEEALSLLSLPLPPSKAVIEEAAAIFLDFGVGKDASGWVIIRSGELGAYVKSRATPGRWIGAFWSADDADKVVDVTGAGNSFLGGLAAGIVLSNGDMYTATLYATVSASFVIEQAGLPSISEGEVETWNGDVPLKRLETLKRRLQLENETD